MQTQSLAAQIRSARAEMMAGELETVALGLFRERGFNEVTVEEISIAARISVRTFYRYFPTKEDVLQLRLDKLAEELGAALTGRASEEAPFEALRLALEEVARGQDLEVLRNWMSVISDTPAVLRGVVGGLQIKVHQVIAEYFGSRLGMDAHDLVPTMLAAAAGGVFQAAHAQWFLLGGDLADMLSDSIGVLEHGIAGLG